MTMFRGYTAVLLLLCLVGFISCEGVQGRESTRALRARVERDLARLEHDMQLDTTAERGDDEGSEDSFVATSSTQTNDAPDCSSIKGQSLEDLVKRITAAAKDARAGNNRHAHAQLISTIFTCVAPFEQRGESSFDWKFAPHNSGDSRKDACLRAAKLAQGVMREYVRELVEAGQKVPISILGSHISALSEVQYHWFKATFNAQRPDWWDKRFGSIDYGCTWAKPKIDIKLPVFSDPEFSEFKEKLVQASGKCTPVRKMTVPEAVAKIEAWYSPKAKGSYVWRSKQIDEFLTCMVPWKEYKHGKAWGQVDVATDRKPLEGANCPLLYGVVNAIAARHFPKNKVTSEGPETLFHTYLEAYGIDLDITPLSHMLDACDHDRPYRDWGTTNRDGIGRHYRIRMSMDPGFPTDTENRNSMRVQLFCLHGVLLKEGSYYLRPGQSTAYTVAHSKWDESEGLTCTLNQGLDSIRKYRVNGHDAQCMSTAFWYKRFGYRDSDPKHHFATKPDPSCPYSWVEAEDSTQYSPHIVLKMKPRDEYLKVEKVDTDVCAPLRNEKDIGAAASSLKAVLESASKEGGDEAKFAERLIAHLKCYVPTKEIDGHAFRTREAKCDMFGGMINRWAHEYAEWAARHEYTGFEVLHLYIERSLKIKLTYDHKKVIDAMWEACGNDRDINKKRGNFGQDFGVGPAELFQVTFASNFPSSSIPDDYNERGWRPYISCTEGVTPEDDKSAAPPNGGYPQWARCKTPLTQGACTIVTRRDLRKPYDGIACYARVGNDKCSFVIKWRRLGDEPGAAYIESGGKGCDMKVEQSKSKPYSFEFSYNNNKA